MHHEILQYIRSIVGPENLLTSREELLCHGMDAGSASALPIGVALPQKTEQISEILKLANRYDCPITPRGAGSGMTGGCVPIEGGLVLSLAKMNQILEIDADNLTCVVEPGVITGELQEELRKQGLMYPPDPASLKFCSIGGNAAECAGGPAAVKYGVTRDYIMGLEVVLPSGEIITTGARTEKSVAGYDLTHLFIGSEGTLGIFTKLTLRLLPLPPARTTFLLLFDTLTDAAAFVSLIMKAGFLPATIEYMDQTAIGVVRHHLTDLLTSDTLALLLIEFDGSVIETREQQDTFSDFLLRQNIVFTRADSPEEVARLWKARRILSPSVFSLKPHKISEDVVVPRSKIPELVHYCEKLAHELDIIILTFGHAGDGNIHVNIMLDKADPTEHQNGLLARERIFQHVVSLQGSISGEHGIGLSKSKYLSLELNEATISLMLKIKKLFDPNNILNPGKIFPSQPDYSKRPKT